MKAILKHAWRAALLDRSVYNEWMYNSAATADAALIVIGVALANVVAEIVAGRSLSLDLITIILQTVISALAGWIFLAVATWFAGTKMFHGYGDMQSVIRMQGLAYLPNVLGAVALVLAGLGVFPVGVLRAVTLAGYIWYLVAATVGTSVALSLKNRDAGLAVLVGAAILYLFDLLIRGSFSGISRAFGSLN
jgi:hypothetical protein